MLLSKVFLKEYIVTIKYHPEISPNEKIKFSNDYFFLFLRMSKNIVYSLRLNKFSFAIAYIYMYIFFWREDYTNL